jgi:methylmalonyl-CoA/ethylmalonyl-CoA epimerase
MSTNKFNHVGIVTPDFDVVRTVFGDGFGCEVSDVEPMPELGIEFLWTKFGDAQLEFIRPVSSDSEAAALVLAGRGGAHHIAISVPDVDRAITELAERGLPAATPTAVPGVRGGRIAFLNPEATGGLLIELVEDSQTDRAS